MQLSVEEPSKPVKRRTTTQPALYGPHYATTPFYPPQYQYGYPYPNGYIQYGAQPQQPIIKEYKINVSGPVADHARIYSIYEDIIPSTQFNLAFNTIGERINLIYFIRRVMIREYDGEDIDIEGTTKMSLLSYLKFLDLNPYDTNLFSNNPYKGLPDDMLLYRSCYPIRYDRYSNSTQCAKNSIGMNIRIYRMNFGEYNVKSDPTQSYLHYDLWREIDYYEFIREHIIKKKVCPNFISIYAWFICQKCNIDFDKILQIKGKHRLNNQRFIKNVEELKHLNQEDNETYHPIPSNISMRETRAQTGGNGNDNNNDCDDENRTMNISEITRRQQRNITTKPVVTLLDNRVAYSGKALIALTEAPTYNFIGWSSRSYRIEGNIRKMVNSGYHKSEVWKSILFQLMVGMYVMQLYGIAFNDFTLKDNVYIKDITLHNNITRYWKYIINGIEYYIPNHGFLLMIDSNYKDIGEEMFNVRKKKSKGYKIISNIYADQDVGGTSLSKEYLDKLVHKSFKCVFSNNNFSNSFADAGGTKPPEDITQLISRIENDNTSVNIDHYIFTHMRGFMNNRIGTYVKGNELMNVRVHELQDFKKGDICAYMFNVNTYIFVLVMKIDNNKAHILMRGSNKNKPDVKNPNIEEVIVSVTDLYKYSEHVTIMQDYRANESNLNEEELLETYILDENNV